MDDKQRTRELLCDVIRMAELSAWIYDDSLHGFPALQPELEERVVSLGLIGSSDISTQAAAIVTEDVIYLVFRGSQSILSRDGLRDWLRNLNFLFRAEFYGICAHLGFVKALRPVIRQLREIVARYPDRKLIRIGGHSLGGALALLTAVMLESEFRQARADRRIELTTFGQPRVSRERHLGLALQGVTYTRVQNGSDIVPRKPWAGYSHGGTRLYLSNKGEMLINPSWARMLGDRALTFWQRGTDHKITDYLRQLLQVARRL